MGNDGAVEAARLVARFFVGGRTVAAEAVSSSSSWSSAPRFRLFLVGGGGGGADGAREAVREPRRAGRLGGGASSSKIFRGFRVRWPRPPASVTARSSTMSITSSFGIARRRAGCLTKAGGGGGGGAGVGAGAGGAGAGGADGTGGGDVSAVAVPGNRVAVIAATTPSDPFPKSSFLASFSSHSTRAPFASSTAAISASLVISFGFLRASITLELRSAILADILTVSRWFDALKPRRAE